MKEFRAVGTPEETEGKENGKCEAVGNKIISRRRMIGIYLVTL